MRRKRVPMLTLMFVFGLVTLASSQLSPRDHPSVASAVTSAKVNHFPIGVFEDAHIVAGDPERFKAMLTDLQARGIDSVLFTNNDIARDSPLLHVADSLGMRVYMSPANDWNVSWWPERVPSTLARARQVAAPAVQAFAGHPSFGGYVVKDEPGLEDRDKLVLLTQALRELDREHSVSATLIGVDRVGPLLGAADFDVLQIDVYPVASANPPCDLTMNGFGYPEHDFVSYIRTVAAGRSPGTPLWIILQTHSFDSGGFSLRPPLPTELRMQQWLGLGEGAHGIFWFIYSSQQGWTGLVENEALYSEVTELSRRLDPLRPILLSTRKVADRFTVVGPGLGYISTLETADGRHRYVLAVNRNCLQPQPLVISSSSVSGALRDLESGRIYRQGEPIEFRPGDGRLFEVLNIMLYRSSRTHLTASWAAWAKKLKLI